MPQSDSQWIAECLEGEYEDWEHMTPDQQQIAVTLVENKMIEDGLTTSEAIKQLDKYYIRGALLGYVKHLQEEAAGYDEVVDDLFDRSNWPPERS